MRNKNVIVVITCILALIQSVSLSAQTDMERAAANAVCKGDYAEAITQLEAYRAYLITAGISENSSEVLKLSKRIRQAEECRAALPEADRNYGKLDSKVMAYKKCLSSLSLNSYDRSVFLDLRQRKSDISTLARQVQGEYSGILAKFPEDKHSEARYASAAAIPQTLVAPETALETVFVANPSAETLHNYLIVLSPEKAAAEKIREDYKAWTYCQNSRSLVSCDSYLQSGYRLFRENVEDLRADLQNEQWRMEDEKLWRSTDKTSKVSLLKYLNAPTGQYKQYGDLARKMYAAVEQREIASAAERKEWERLNKLDVNELKDYMRRYPSTVHKEEIFSYLEDFTWAKTDTSAIRSLQAFIGEWPDSKYRNKANAYISLIGGRYKMSVSKYDEAYTSYMAAAMYLKFNEADTRNYKFLCDWNKKRLAAEKEKNAYERWNKCKTMELAEDYIRAYPGGSYLDTIEGWVKSEKLRVERERQYRDKCARLEKVLGCSYGLYSSTRHNNSSYEGYYRYLKNLRKHRYGCGFQISGGMSSMAFSMVEDSSGYGLGGLLGVKVGRNCSSFNFQTGCEFCYLSGKYGDIQYSGWDYTPYALARFNMPNRVFHISVGGGYGLLSEFGYTQLSCGWTKKKWYDTELFIRVGYGSDSLGMSFGTQVGFQLYFNVF